MPYAQPTLVPSAHLAPIGTAIGASSRGALIGLPRGAHTSAAPMRGPNPCYTHKGHTCCKTRKGWTCGHR